MKSSLILASTSPRRIDLMKQVGFEFRVESPDADETPMKGESPRALVTRLAREKAFSIARKSSLRQGAARRRAGRVRELVIAADTIVVAPDGKTVLGKPRHAAEARSMLRRLAGKKHSVFTGYCILPVETDGSMGRALTRVVISRVKMRKLSPRQIQSYVRTGEPMDKAGSYAAQGLGMSLVEVIQGSYTNVVGLPMCQLVTDLEQSFGVSIFK